MAWAGRDLKDHLVPTQRYLGFFSYSCSIHYSWVLKKQILLQSMYETDVEPERWTGFPRSFRRTWRKPRQMHYSTLSPKPATKSRSHFSQTSHKIRHLLMQQCQQPASNISEQSHGLPSAWSWRPSRSQVNLTEPGGGDEGGILLYLLTFRSPYRYRSAKGRERSSSSFPYLVKQ